LRLIEGISTTEGTQIKYPFSINLPVAAGRESITGIDRELAVRLPVLPSIVPFATVNSRVEFANVLPW
jgi:hypothetical protein